MEQTQQDRRGDPRLARVLTKKLTGVSDHAQRCYLLREFCTRVGPEAAVEALYALVNDAMEGEHRNAWVAVAIALCTEALPYDMLGDMYRAARIANLDVMRLLMFGGHVTHRTAQEKDFTPDDYIENLTLGERKSRARLQDPHALERLLYDPDPSVVRILLANPRLTEASVLKLASRRPNRVGVLREIARVPKWVSRASIQRALALSPYTPVRVTLTLMPLFSTAELVELSRDGSVHPLVAMGAKTFLAERGWEPPTVH